MHISELDEGSRQTLERILSTDIRAFTSDDVAFLKARRGYLTGEQLVVFKGVLEGEAPADQEGPEAEPVPTPTEAPPRRNPADTAAEASASQEPKPRRKPRA